MTEHRALVPSRFAEQQEVPAFAGTREGTTPATTIFTPRRRAKFCDHLANHGNVRLAAKAAGVSPQTAYRARRSCADLAACWDAALVLARDVAEQVLADRALNGVEEAVFYHGEEVARRRRYDSRLLLAHLARLDRQAEREEAQALAGQFDDALVKLEAGEALPRAVSAQAGAAGGACDEGAGEEELSPVELALRWLEEQGFEPDEDEDAGGDPDEDAMGDPDDDAALMEEDAADSGDPLPDPAQEGDLRGSRPGDAGDWRSYVGEAPADEALFEEAGADEAGADQAGGNSPP